MRNVRALLVLAGCIGGSVPALVNCSSNSADGASSAETGGVEYVDCNQIAGVPGKLPKDDSLSPMMQIGRCTWVLSTGRTTSNPNFSTDKVPEGLHGTEYLGRTIARKNGNVSTLLDTFGATSEADRTARWEKYGLMNDPGCKASTQEDEYGLRLDTCVDEFSAGVVGFRKFKNPDFTGAAKDKWMALKAQGHDALMQAYASDATLEPPYLVGPTCGSCHTSFDPAKPPADPSHPKWENLKFTLGNQYFREGRLFQSTTKGQGDFKWHVLDVQQPGTSDTSRIPQDHIDNPNAINPIYSLLSRPWHDQKLKKGQITFDLTANICPDLTDHCADSDKVQVAGALALLKAEQSKAAIGAIRRIVQNDGEVHPVQGILKGAEDSVGPVGALLRVYVNIGMCNEVWTRHFDPVDGMEAQTPLGIDEIYSDCPAYEQMLNRVPATFLFLASQGPIYLKNAPGGADLIKDDLAEKGKLVFADNCASCHSSKQPPADEKDPKGWFRNAIQQDDWLQGNFLSDDSPHAVTDIGTNIARASHTNHMNGHVWGDAYASQTYDDRTWPGPVTLENPYGDDIQYTGPDGGPGYYRTPTLISIWTRAPFMHNRSLGDVDPQTNLMVVPGPGVADRVHAFESAAKMLLSPELRPKTTVNGHTYSGWVKTTSADSVLEFQKLGIDFKIHIPTGTPVKLFANLDPNDFMTKAELAGVALHDKLWSNFDPNDHVPNLVETTGTALLKLGIAADLIENKGHTFGSDLSQDDKAALIEYLKTL